MTTTTTPQLALTRIFDAPRALLYQAFTDPDHLAAVRSAPRSGLIERRQNPARREPRP
jgi:uncharacterized protein YndB with AHSA1/START domain